MYAKKFFFFFLGNRNEVTCLQGFYKGMIKEEDEEEGSDPG